MRTGIIVDKYFEEGNFMKRNVYLLILVLSLFVIGCGSSGGPTTSGIPGDGGSGGNGGGIVPSGPVGTIAVTFPGSPSAEPLAATYATLIDPANYGTEGGFRVTASRYETSTVFAGFIEGPPDPDTGEPTSIPTYRTVYTRVYFNFADNVVPGSIMLKVPVYAGPDGYLIEVMSFSDNILNPSFDNVFDPSSTQMRRYAYLDNVQISEGQNINTVTLSPIANNTVLFTRPDSITAETPYSMLVSYNGIRVPLRNTFNFLDNNSNNFVFASNVMDNSALTYTVGRPFTRIAPAGASGDNIYFQGQFYIYDSMLSDSEQSARLWKKYRLNAPNSLSNPVSQLLNQPGTIDIIFN